MINIIFYIKKITNWTNFSKDDINIILNIYSNFRKNKLLKESYLNHGDIAKGNLIPLKREYTVIDFDEATVTTPLYDFAVICVKFFQCKNGFDIDKIKKLKSSMENLYPQYQNNDYFDILIFYLDKIILEKIYLHQIGRIDLFSKKQKKDNYVTYLHLLKKLLKKRGTKLWSI